MLDIKSKSTHKRIIFVISLLIITALINGIFFLTHKMNSSMEIVVQDDYYQSYQLREKVTQQIYSLAEILNYYKSEEYIIGGNTVFYDENYLPFDIRIKYEDFEDAYMNDHPEASDIEVFGHFAEAYPDEFETYKTERINKDLANYKAILASLENEGVEYYIESEDVIKTNKLGETKDYYLSSKLYFTFDESDLITSFEDFEPFLHGIHALEHFPQDKLYMTINKSVLENQARIWAFEKGKYKPSIILLFASAAVLAACLFYMAYEYKDKYFPWVKNTMYFDIKLIVYAILASTITAIEAEYYRFIGTYLVLPASLILSFATLNVYLSIVKHYHDKNLISKIWVLQMLMKIFRYIGTIFSKFPTMVRMMPTPYKAKDLNNIINGVRSIKHGDLESTIQTKSRGLYKTLANDINTITDGLKAAVQNELKSERMRTELISNVSHDIRTPLTSIITYVDLIKRTNDPEKRAQYFQIIDQKSQRLKNLTDDLFEASKVNSGNVPVHLETIDLQFLLSQCLGELSEKMEASSLEFIINYYHTHKYVNADGNIMFRVIENLMFNIFKYSLPNSRVYINIEEDDEYLMLVFKNISAYPLNVNPDDLFERFKRGDESRSTEGSGLGLSITEKLIILQGGRPEINIDGDLFKVTVWIKKAEV